MNVLLEIIFIVGLFAMIFFGPASINIGLCRMSNDKMKLNAGDSVKCCIPVFNFFYGWKKYTGSNTPSLSGIATILFYLSFISRVIVMFFFFENDNIQNTTVLIFLACSMVYWIFCAIDVFRILNDSGVYSGTAKILYAIAVPVGQIVIGFYLPKNIMYYEKDKKGAI